MEEAIQALRRGAYDFLPKPCKLFEIANVLKRVGEKLALTRKTVALERQLERWKAAPSLIGETPSMRRVKQLIDKIAPTDSAVLILGETGTGKELVARRIHELSLRATARSSPSTAGPWRRTSSKANSSATAKGPSPVPTPRKGLFEVAHGGTLFLDELGDLDKGMQVKLLRFLESGEIRRVGENEFFHVDVRIVCATNRDLQDMVAEGTFREDLFFRVNTFEIHLSPLRERKDDIPGLAETLIARHLKRPQAPADILSPAALESAVARVERQRPRAGQRAGARGDSLRRQNHPAGASAGQRFRASALRTPAVASSARHRRRRSAKSRWT